MKICLIHPPQIFNKGIGLPSVFLPLGLAYIAAVLAKDHEVTVIDACAEGWQNLSDCNGNYYLGLTFEEIDKRIRDLKPDICGITVPFSVNADSAIQTASVIKKIDKKIKTIFGGPHPSVLPEKVLSSPDVDFVIIGEGEASIKELIDNIYHKSYSNLSAIKGIGFKKEGVPVVTPPRPFIQDMDSIPFPARELFPVEAYFAAFRAGESSRSLYVMHERWASLFSSRGCPFQCNFCSIHLTMGRPFRPRSPENVYTEIERLITDYGIRHINFEDDNITFDKNRLHKICDIIISKGMNITWSTPNGIRADIIDDDLVRKMKKSGCRRVFVAPESGVQRILNEIIGKKLDLRKVSKAVELFKKHGITVDGSFVIGFIGESKRDICQTILYAMKLKRLGMNKAGFHIAAPLYGTRLYEEALQKGYLKEGVIESSMHPFHSLIETPEWSGKELRQLRGIANFLVNYTVNEKIKAIAKHGSSLPGYIKYLRGLLHL